ncbi:serine hydrolase domain-containing protein [Alkalitalea saponilacus]|uniref:CubicO group peptidase, beta-lactamase class C family n=1 Tax=Alkalitalea saponilacus TaxID=889453 RepID=A0A1T5HS44_9BACT|nr:serine hydrolase [Alkalitalea saponilacus]ASB50052.1 penicillin-binding protein [Alkalitalea saponilacus]SKC23432.1 CubicO group peptidase, beta-lactamase class C family [Alkalitalea saponilacus]
MKVFNLILFSLIFLADAVATDESECHQRDSLFADVVVLKNQDNIIPLQYLHQGRFACIVVGNADEFYSRLSLYKEMPLFGIPPQNPEVALSILDAAKDYDRLIIVIESSSTDKEIEQAISRLSKQSQSVVLFLDDAYRLINWKGVNEIPALMVSGGNCRIQQDLAAQILFGGRAAAGRLPYSVEDIFIEGAGISTENLSRFSYHIPGLDDDEIHHHLKSKIDDFLTHAIEELAFPGCQVFMAVNGRVIIHEAYGHHTYLEKTPVHLLDLYDVASITKIAGPLPLLMQLTDNEIIGLDDAFSEYWGDWRSRLFRRSNKSDVTLRQLLAHQGGLVPYINFYANTKDDGLFRRRFYRHQFEERFTLEIDDHLYLRDRYLRRVFRDIRRSSVSENPEYRYSCLSFLIYPSVIEKLTDRNFEEALYEDIYKPLGISRMVYNPLQKGFYREEIPPTEMDLAFRSALVHGRVHDEAAAVMGGVSGNAGLFSNANDLGKLMQMYLNGGSYGGEVIFSQDTMEEFNRVQFPEMENRRALGFDKPHPDNDERTVNNAFPALGAHSSSFGHLGFTGTMVWADPEHQMVYVFLSNRVYPSRSHNAISRLRVRTALLQMLYDEVKNQ